MMIYLQVENECVVAEILQRNSGWKISSPPRFQSWERRGFYIPQLTTEQSNCLIRCAPDDGANGFFVALFHRLSIESQHKIIQCHSKVEMHLDSEHHALDEDVDISIYKKRMHSSGKKDDNKRNGTNMQWQHFSKRFKY